MEAKFKIGDKVMKRGCKEIFRVSKLWKGRLWSENPYYYDPYYYDLIPIKPGQMDVVGICEVSLFPVPFIWDEEEV